MLNKRCRRGMHTQRHLRPPGFNEGFRYGTSDWLALRAAAFLPSSCRPQTSEGGDLFWRLLCTAAVLLCCGFARNADSDATPLYTHSTTRRSIQSKDRNKKHVMFWSDPVSSLRHDNAAVYSRSLNHPVAYIYSYCEAEPCARSSLRPAEQVRALSSARSTGGRGILHTYPRTPK